MESELAGGHLLEKTKSNIYNLWRKESRKKKDFIKERKKELENLERKEDQKRKETARWK